MKKYTIAPAILMALIALLGCQNEAEKKAECSSEETKTIVANIFNKSLKEYLLRTQLNINTKNIEKNVVVHLDGIRTSKSSPELHRNECKGVLAVTIPQNRRDVLLKRGVFTGVYEPVEITPEGLSVPVEFTTQLTDDLSNQYVDLIGHIPLAMTITRLAILQLL